MPNLLDVGTHSRAEPDMMGASIWKTRKVVFLPANRNTHGSIPILILRLEATFPQPSPGLLGTFNYEALVKH